MRASGQATQGARGRAGGRAGGRVASWTGGAGGLVRRRAGGWAGRAGGPCHTRRQRVEWHFSRGAIQLVAFAPTCHASSMRPTERWRVGDWLSSSNIDNRYSTVIIGRSIIHDRPSINNGRRYPNIIAHRWLPIVVERPTFDHQSPIIEYRQSPITRHASHRSTTIGRPSSSVDRP